MQTQKTQSSACYLLLITMMLINGCALMKSVAKPDTSSIEAPPVVTQTISIEDKCPWINKTPIAQDTLFAVGVSNERGNIPVSRKNAANQARVELSQVIETKVKALFDGFLKEHADLLDPEAPATSEEFSRMVTRLTTDQTIIGSQIPEYCWDKENHLYYALAMIPGENIANEIKDQTAELIMQRKAAIAEENLDETILRMDEVLKSWHLSEGLLEHTIE